MHKSFMVQLIWVVFGTLDTLLTAKYSEEFTNIIILKTKKSNIILLKPFKCCLCLQNKVLHEKTNFILVENKIFQSTGKTFIEKKIQVTSKFDKMLEDSQILRLNENHMQQTMQGGKKYIFQEISREINIKNI